MKKLFISIVVVLAFTVVFMFCFRHFSAAKSIENDLPQEMVEEALLAEAENDEKIDKYTEIKEYIKEKIIPIVVGVLTSLSALLATLASIKKALGGIGKTKESFDSEAKSRAELFEKQSAYLSSQAEAVKEATALIPKLEAEIVTLKESIGKLAKENLYLGKMVCLGLGASEATVKSGNGRKMDRLLSECEELSGSRITDTDENEPQKGEAGEEK